MNLSYLFQRLLQWLPDRADLPEGLRIGLPMMAGLLLFSFLGDSASGVNALICAWLVGVQGRNLAYPKRAGLLSKSALLCCISSALALLSLIHPWLGISVLGAIGLLYGLSSNQRKYIQLLTYNAGFCLICGLHLLESGTDWKMLLLSSLFGSWLAVISAVVAGPWMAIRQGEQLLASVQRKFGFWCNILSHSDAANVGQRLALREQLDDAIAVLAHWLLEMPDKAEVQRIARQLESSLILIETLESIGRLQQNDAASTALQQYLANFASELKTHREQGTEPTPLPLGDKPQPLLLDAADRLALALDPQRPLAADWRERLELIWPSDAQSVRNQWRKALVKHSREWHHGLRILFTLLCCQAVVELLQLPQGYWVTLTAYIVLMVAPLGQLQARIWSRFYGTVLGSVLALGLIWYLGAGSWLLPATCLSAFLAFATFYKARYEIHVFWLTMLMVFAITLLLPSDPYIAFYRALDTFTGALMAFLAMHLFIPSWTRRWLDSYVCHFIELERAWLASINTGKADNALRWQAHAALRQLGQEVGFLKLEPNTGQRELQDWQSFLWLGLTLHCTLVLVARQQQKPPLHLAEQQLAAWPQLFRQRFLVTEMHQSESRPAPNSTDAPAQLSAKQAEAIPTWVMQDIAHLYAWLDWQRPYALGGNTHG
ncbi:FUSC family protein [Shewanella algae]|uniref:FUSC family protein n=1 Tax=Shewanella algae TaxID=38313 RepID=UPI0031F51587